MIEESTLRDMLASRADSCLVITSVDPTAASPSWWGGDSERYRVQVYHKEKPEKNYYVKVMREHTSEYIDWTTSFNFAIESGRQGLGPEVIASDPDKGILVMEDLGSEASTTTLDFFDEDRIEALIALKKAAGKISCGNHSRIVFDEIIRLQDLINKEKGSLPIDFKWIWRSLEPAFEKIKSYGHEMIPCHGDGNASNIMFYPYNKNMYLLDWDTAGLMDPLQDLGVILQELSPEDKSARSIFEMYWGTWDESLFDRCRIYGIADCVRWGLVGLYADLKNPGTHEYSKFSDWQFLRARMELSDPIYTKRVLNL